MIRKEGEYAKGQPLEKHEVAAAPRENPTTEEKDGANRRIRSL